MSEPMKTVTLTATFTVQIPKDERHDDLCLKLDTPVRVVHANAPQGAPIGETLQCQTVSVFFDVEDEG